MWMLFGKMWIILFLNKFNHATRSLIHIRLQLSTLMGELSTKSDAACSFIVQVWFNKYALKGRQKFVRIRGLQSRIKPDTNGCTLIERTALWKARRVSHDKTERL